MRRFTRHAIPAALAVCGLFPAHAHFVFLELPPSQPGAVHMRFSDEPLEITNNRYQRLIEATEVRTKSGAGVEMNLGEEAMVGAVAEAETAVGGSLTYGVLDRSEQGRGVFLLLYHGKATGSAEDAAAELGLPLEIVGEADAEVFRFTVLLEGVPVPEAEVWMVGPGVTDPVTVSTDGGGAAELALHQRGWVGIRAMAPVEGEGTHGDEAFELTRHYTTLTFYHELPEEAAR